MRGKEYVAQGFMNALGFVMLSLLPKPLHSHGELGGPERIADRQDFLAQVSFQPVNTVGQRPMPGGVSSGGMEGNGISAKVFRVVFSGIQRNVVECLLLGQVILHAVLPQLIVDDPPTAGIVLHREQPSIRNPFAICLCLPGYDRRIRDRIILCCNRLPILSSDQIVNARTLL